MAAGGRMGKNDKKVGLDTIPLKLFSPEESLALSEFEFGAMVHLYSTRPEADPTLLQALQHVESLTFRCFTLAAGVYK
jgi:hypothetical protein